MPSELSQLAALISSSVATIEQRCAEKGLEVPSLQTVFSGEKDRAFRGDADVANAIKIAVAATHHLNAIIESPYATLRNASGAGLLTAALHAVLRTHVAEALHDAGPKGLPIDELSKRIEQNPNKIGRLLRLLATYHIFEEVSPDVFAHNRVSAVLDSNKSVEQVLQHPDLKHDDTPGFAAYIEHLMDDTVAAATYGLPDILTSPNTKFSDEPNDTALNVLTKGRTDYWEWIEKPEQKYRVHRFGIGMQGYKVMQPPSSALVGFDWKSLKPQDIVVDVGSGVGTVSLSIAKELTEVKFVLQDRPAVMEHAKQVWSAELPEAVSSDRVTLQPHNFFDAQPVKEASVYLLQHILHDWSDPYAIKILKRLRDVSGKDTRLVLMESIVAHACRVPADQNKIPGGATPEAPEPLLANYGAVTGAVYNQDMIMMTLFNSQERTLKHFDSLLKEAGWSIARVHRHDSASSTFHTHHIEAIPIF